MGAPELVNVVGLNSGKVGHTRKNLEGQGALSNTCGNFFGPKINKNVSAAVMLPQRPLRGRGGSREDASKAGSRPLALPKIRV